LLDLMKARLAGEAYDEAAYDARVRQAVAECVRRQVATGIDIVADGEQSKPGFFTYVKERLAGFVPRPGKKVPFFDAERQAFPEYYQEYFARAMTGGAVAPVVPMVCTGPVKYRGEAALAQDIANLKAAAAASGAKGVFMPACAPSGVGANEYYKTEEEYFHAVGAALRSEYKAIVDAGLTLQIDDPRMVSEWDSFKDMDLKQYRKWMQGRIAHINHALRGLPAERIRYHTCYGVNFGPRVSDLQLDDVLDLLFTIDAGFYSFEAANPRHDHEWRVLAKIKLPAGKKLIPGAVTHSNVTIEHPEVVADRMRRWIGAAGAGNVLFGNDCGFCSTAGNTEIPESVAWAKLKALGDGARIAGSSRE
jgi:5-methyltetrahydropteroyltriglutamate--homocysteine methyltransferase